MIALSKFWVYWLLFLVPAGVAFSPIKGDKYVSYLLWVIVGLLAILVIGLRYEIAADWINYLYYLDASAEKDLIVLLKTGNANGSGYMYLNHLITQKAGGGIYVVNLICATIFMVGVMQYCRKQPIPWIALAVAMPYLVCAVGMAYTRQAAAMGFFMWGLSFLRKGNEGKFVFLILVGSTFHLTVLGTLPLILFTREKMNWLFYPMLLGIFYVFYSIFVQFNVLETYADIYAWTMSRYSQGGIIRTLMNALPVLVAFYFRDEIKKISPDYKLIKWMSLAALVCVPLAIVATTMIDRLGLYLMPLQLALWPRVIAVQKTIYARSVWAAMILSYYSAALFVFYHFGKHAEHFVPYKMFPFHSSPIYPQTLPMF